MPAVNPPSLRELDGTNLEVLVELMLLAASADDEFSEQEKQHLFRSVESLTDRTMPQSTLDELAQRVVSDVQTRGRAALLASVRQRLASAGARRAAFALVVQVVVADRIIRTSERELLFEVAEALEIDRDVAANMVAKLSS